MRVEFRMFSAPEFEQLCDPSTRPSRLTSRYTEMRIPLGEWFDLRRLRVVALDSHGHALPPAPVAIEVKQAAPNLFDLHSEMISQGRILPVQAGRARIRVRSLCAEPFAEITVEVGSASLFTGDWTLEAEAQNNVVRGRFLIEDVGAGLLANLLIDNHVLEGTVSAKGTDFDVVLAHADGSGPGHSEVLHLRGRSESGKILGSFESADGMEQGKWRASKTQF